MRDLGGEYGRPQLLTGGLGGLALALRRGDLAVRARSGAILAAVVSAALFGMPYIMLTGIYLVWSVAVFAERPSLGIAPAFVMIALGQAIGARLAGMTAGLFGLAATFPVFALLGGFASLIRPRVDSRP